MIPYYRRMVKEVFCQIVWCGCTAALWITFLVGAAMEGTAVWWCVDHWTCPGHSVDPAPSPAERSVLVPQ